MGLFDFLTGSGNNSTAGEAQRLVQEGALLLDVRTPQEFASKHVQGATNIPVQELSQRLKELPKNTKTVVVYCKSGGRSASAASVLRNAGYTVCDLGAMSNWPG
jgi:phage shock protein E